MISRGLQNPLANIVLVLRCSSRAGDDSYGMVDLPRNHCLGPMLV